MFFASYSQYLKDLLSNPTLEIDSHNLLWMPRYYIFTIVFAFFSIIMPIAILPSVGFYIYLYKLQLDLFFQGSRDPLHLKLYMMIPVALYFLKASCVNIGTYNLLLGINMTLKENMSEAEEGEQY